MYICICTYLSIYLSIAIDITMYMYTYMHVDRNSDIQLSGVFHVKLLTGHNPQCKLLSKKNMVFLGEVPCL